MRLFVVYLSVNGLSLISNHFRITGLIKGTVKDLVLCECQTGKLTEEAAVLRSTLFLDIR